MFLIGVQRVPRLAKLDATEQLPSAQLLPLVVTNCVTIGSSAVMSSGILVGILTATIGVAFVDACVSFGESRLIHPAANMLRHIAAIDTFLILVLQLGLRYSMALIQKICTIC